ncbi:MAG: transposase [Magnetospirillum sp.]|nr:transposase [Magnetospirillum sp.]
MLWVGRERPREGVRPFLDLLGEDGCRRIKAVAKYGHDVIDRVRVDEANRLRGDKKARKVVKTARWLLLRNRENLKRPQDQVRPDELLAANQSLMTVCVMKDELKQLWRQSSVEAAKAAWRAWWHKTRDSGIEPLIRLARKLEPYLPGIVASASWRLNTSILEGINNRIKMIKRMAYGFRDDADFFLKIRAAFPGLPR